MKSCWLRKLKGTRLFSRRGQLASCSRFYFFVFLTLLLGCLTSTLSVQYLRHLNKSPNQLLHIFESNAGPAFVIRMVLSRTYGIAELQNLLHSLQKITLFISRTGYLFGIFKCRGAMMHQFERFKEFTIRSGAAASHHEPNFYPIRWPSVIFRKDDWLQTTPIRVTNAARHKKGRVVCLFLIPSCLTKIALCYITG